MPRRKKNGQSPARVPVGPSDGDNPGYRLPPGHHDAMENNKDTIVKSMQEMFSHLDPEVIHIVLSECDFKVENAMDSLLELSEAAADAAPIPSVSGFERTAAALLSPHHFSEPRTDSDTSKPPQQPPSSTSSSILRNELDLLVDGELERLIAQHDVKDKHPSSPCDVPFVSYPPFPQQALPELLQSSLEPKSKGSSTKQIGPVASHLEHKTAASANSLDHTKTRKDTTDSGQQLNVDFTHLVAEIPEDKQKPLLDLAASGRPSAFQVYKKQEPLHSLSAQLGDMPSDVVVGGAKSKVQKLNQEPQGTKFSTWNLGAPVFSPHVHGNQVPTFISPVAQPPFNWLSKPRHLVPVSQAPLKPSATIPKSWAVHGAEKHSDQNSRLRLDGKLLVLLRGAPGSGKSTLARALLDRNQGGIILSTDDYFTQNGEYRFDPTFLGEAHEWNHKRAKAAFEKGTNPIIIDNTNMQGWEMKPYVVQALRHGYKVLFREPDTWWKNKPRELERRTSHNVPVEKIRRMLDGYERFVTVQAIMGSMTPEHKQGLFLDNRSSKPKTSGIPCPDLVEQPELIEGFKKSRPQLFSSLPDVSSIGCSSEVGLLEDSSHKSTETIIIPYNGKPIENVEFSEEDDDMDLGNLDSELDARLQIDQSVGGQRIPDCIVESVMNDDRCGDEMPVAFSESIGQRLKRERSSRRSDFDQMEPADLVKDANQSENEAREEGKDEGAGQMRLVTDEPRNRMPEMLAFVGDWPSQGSLEQRQVRRKEIRRENNSEEADGVSQEINETLIKMQSEPVTEFQKIIDLIQTGAAAIQASSFCLSSPSQSYDEELEKDEEANSSFDKSIGSKPIGKEGREQILNDIDSSRSELPDCVLDRKSSEYCEVSNLTIIGQEELANNLATGVNNRLSDLAREMTSTNSVNPLSTVIGDGASSHTDMGNNNNYTEINCSHINEECHSPVCEGSMEADVNVGSQEKKQRHGRRSVKQCKLALTFTQNCPASSSATLINPIITAQNMDSFWTESNTDVEANSNSTSVFSPTSDLFLESKSDTGCCTQTEPKDFALLWRLNHQESLDNRVITVCNPSSDLKVVCSDSSRFVPERSSGILETVAVHPSGHTEVPYRVMHEKGTQVEQKDLGATQNRFESLRILSRHFKLVTFDTLEDLYDKCHQDLDWTTNLLLDSGERFFRGEDGARGENDQSFSSMCDALEEIIQQNNCGNVLDECCYEDLQKARTAGMEEGTQQLSCGIVSESNKSFSNSIDSSHLEGVADPVKNKKQVDSNSQLVKVSETKLSQPEATEEGEYKVRSEPKLDDGAWFGSLDDGVIIEETRVELEEEIANIDEVHRLLQAQLEESEREEKQRREQRRSSHLDIQSLELKLPTELALQLAELFGPVGVDPGTCSVDDYAVKMDLNLAKLVHHKWKETIQERRRRAALPFHLTKESSAYWADLPRENPGPKKQTRPALISPDGYSLQDTRPGSQVQMPFMDHWNVSHSHVSLRDIIKEEQALQDCSEKSRKSRLDLHQRDGASQFKENQLYSRFPTIDRHFLQDILRDHNYSLTQTELFLQSLLDEEPVKTVVAPEAPRSNQHRTASKEREKRQKNLESIILHYQNTEDPDYEDFRAEASLQRSRQLESFSKAAEAFKQGRKEVASFYAQQGHLHGLRMHEANHRAAVQIFERVNSSLLPKNILDLHGLHVNEALEHLAQVLQDKTSDCEQGLCRPQLSVITGRGNHSQGGVARIRPAVIEYLTKKQYRFTEPKPGLVLVSLK